MLKASQRHLRIGYDMVKGHLTMDYQGIVAERLPPVMKSREIFHHKVVDTSTAKARLVSFHAVFEDQRQVITATYFKRRKRLELRFGKKMKSLSL